ncbi:hypothetical protein [Microbacterium indicum]|uniref:hypothetical protein n=1 Tax=Microbacterium indicum TaxID=358100 RepID=UPI00042A2A80|nr:hypothetical protein [Microbacterium indicum]
MRKYLLGTGLIGAITSGYSLLRGSNAQPFTWRVALAWLSWGITAALSIGMILDIRTATKGGRVSADSPIAGKEAKYSKAAAPETAKKRGRGRK